MRVEIKPARACGKIKVPPSKSMAHRLLICAAMAEGESTVRGISSCEDVSATLDCISALGVRYERQGDDIRVFGIDFSSAKPPACALNCRESGSTIRFLIPPALLSGNTVKFSGASSLMKRPMGIFEELCAERGMKFLKSGDTIELSGALSGGDFKIAGNVSSQFISGLLFALPICKEDSRIHITAPIESRSYINMTISALACFGIFADWKNGDTIFIKGGQKYKPSDVTVEGDYSGAAFPDALNLFSGDVKLSGLNESSLQGDRVYVELFRLLDAGAPTINIADCPDLAPILFAIAAAKHGATFTGTKRLKIKESDRASAMAEELLKLGCVLEIFDDSVTVCKSELHSPKEPIFGHNDHRIVMAMAVLLSTLGGEILGAEAVKKSYPEFFRHLKALGIEVTEYEF